MKLIDLNINLNDMKQMTYGFAIPINLSSCGGGVAPTLKTSHHCAGNITEPEGGRAEIGVLEIYESNTTQ